MANRRAVVTIHQVERLTLSRNGNPRFKLFTDMGNYNTQSDGAISYEIKNHIRHLPARKCLTFNGRNVVIDIEEA